MAVRGTDKPVDGGAVQEFRRDCAAAGAIVGRLSDRQLADILKLVGDAGLAATALAMKPRPEWVTRALAA